MNRGSVKSTEREATANPGVLLAVGLLASYLPARRAARINPLIALRSE